MTSPGSLCESARALLMPVRRTSDAICDSDHVLLGYVTVKCGNVPKVALSKLSEDNILFASSIQRQPR